MRRFVVVSGLVLFLCLPAMAQDSPRAEAFGGYSYSRTQVQGATGINFNGWNGSLAANFNDWFGIVGDLSGHYGSIAGTSPGTKVDIQFHHFLFGPRFTYRKAERLTPFGHGLVGATRAKSGFAGLTASQTELSWAFGGGVDVKVHERVALRVIQADYIQTRFSNTTQNHARLSFGFTFRIGTK